MTSGSIVEQISRLGPQLLEQAAPFILSRRPPLQRGPIGRETVFPREGFVGWWLELQQWAPACTTCDQTREPGGNGPNPTRRRAAAGCNVQNAGPAQKHGQRVGRSCQTLGGNGPNPTRGRAAAGSYVQNAAPARLANWTVLPDPGWQRTKSNAWSCGCWVGGSEGSGSTGSELDGLVRPDGRSRRAFATRFPWSVRGRIHETKINQSCFREGRY